jgi:MoxR-like ATPase
MTSEHPPEQPENAIEPAPASPEPVSEAPVTPAAAAAAAAAAAPAANPTAQRQRASQLAQALRTELQKALIGQTAVIDDVLSALIAGGHVLIEGVPGLGKTLLVRALSRCFGGEFARIQFTPDLMPSDVTGHAVYDLKTEQFKLRKGPVFTNLLLADEINRAPAKTQAALLEVMQERQVTLEGRALNVPLPFMVLATQNPIEQEGTYPLPEAQLDRFMLNIKVSYPSEAEEIEIVSRTTSTGLAEPSPVLTGEDILRMQALVRDIPVAEHVVRHAIHIVRATRVREEGQALKVCRDYLAWGAGPRASQFLVLGAKARALLEGATHATVDHVHAVALPIMRHRIVTNFNAEADGVKSDDVVRLILEAVRSEGSSRALDAVTR